MTTDNQTVVQPDTEGVQGQVSPTEPVLTPAVTPAEPQALTAEQEARVNQMIANATAQAIADAKELGKRELQRAQDRNKAELSRAEQRARLAEGSLYATKAQLQQLDPDVAKEMELAEYRAREQGRAGIEQEEAMKQQQAVFHGQFYSNLSQFITGLGVDPADKRIDWGGDSPNYLEAQRRVLDSVSKIQKEQIQTTRGGLEKRLKDLEAKIKQANIEVNAVETTASAGAAAGSDAEFIKKFGSGELPMDKANVDRYNKITKSY